MQGCPQGSAHKIEVTQYNFLQVVLAIDDSKSMKENGCSTFAMEAVALVSRALGRLEVGEIGIVKFGGAGHIKQIHPLNKPFTDEDGPRVLAQLNFDQDNTIADRPMMELIVSLRHLLEGARQRISGGSLAQTSLNQLVLIMSDGRFHEKESLRRAVVVRLNTSASFSVSEGYWISYWSTNRLFLCG